ncbi:CD63 protein, partial [Alopecoenas beccarii]|nr:CD63 protein [Alopecoenas beccarii]
MAVEGGMKCVKFLVFIFNFIFWVCGVALVAIGIYAQLALDKALAVSSASAAGSPIAILVLGIVIFFVSFFGCCGAWKESYCMVTTFAVLLSIIFLVEVAAAIAGYVFKDKVGMLMGGRPGGLGQWHSPPPDPLGCVSSPPSQFRCCGANNYTDWSTIERFRANDTVPRSCCSSNATSCNVHPTPETVYEKVRPPPCPPAMLRGVWPPLSRSAPQGCLQSIEAWMKKNILIVAAVALGIAFFEILGIIFACCLMKGIRSGYEVM